MSKITPPKPLLLLVLYLTGTKPMIERVLRDE